MKVIEEPQLAVKRKLPWFIDIFLYPISASGIIHIVIFLIVPFVISLIDRFILDWVWPVGEIMSLLLYLLYVGYVFFYLGYCIFDSSIGGFRAPDISMEPAPDRDELVWQLFLILGSIAVCFWPIAVYYIFTKRTDLIFWLLSACGIFFFPMTLLAGVMFDSLDALNPILIIGSIFRTFLQYFGLVLVFIAVSLVIVKLESLLPRSQILFLIFRWMCIYLAMVMAHLLGRFYWRYQEKLNWEV